MSNPVNPLDKFTSYTPSHILLAFDNAESASAFICDPLGIGKAGDDLRNTGCGKGIVVVNEFEDPSYKVSDLTWSFDFFSPTTPNTTISSGNFTVVDTRGNQFPSFLRRVSKRLDVPQSRIVFYLLTVFRGRNSNDSRTENYPTKPLIFNITDGATGYREGMINMFSFNFVLLYNTFSQLPNHSRLDQFTITNSEHNPSRSIPTTTNIKAEILPRREADRVNSFYRSERLKSTAPMRTLKDVMKGFEADLKEMRYTNRGQLQEFMSIIRDGAVKKIKPPSPKRVKSGQPLPITYKVNLASVYSDYPVDNRNLMTEQVENQQQTPGIASLTIPPGSDIFSAVDTIMKLSTKTGDDVRDGYAFKTVMTSVTDCERTATNTINISRYKIPKNKQLSTDTGPDKDGTVNTLTFEYMNSTSGYDISSLNYATSPATDVVILEENSADLTNDPLSVSSQREQITFERAETGGYSGLRVAASPTNYGLQDANSAVLTDTLKHRYTLSQNTLTVVNISGNADLYSDIARNPVKVAKLQEDDAKLYRFPEYFPMYVNLKVRISKSTNFGASGDDEDYWYHTYHYHLSGVTNIIRGGKFTQQLRLLSTDDAI